jgi:heat-inducible transcriptional repressor
MRLVGRKEATLRIIVEEYIAQAVPVASQTIVNKYGLEVSPATIRNDVAYLESEGYVTRPHTSAGSVPTDKAYRYYVTSLSEDIGLSPIERHLIYQLYQETKEEIEQWLKLAAALLARFVHNIAVITYPVALRCRFRHLDVVALQDFLALLILVLSQAKVRQQVLSFSRRVTQEELTKLANKLNVIYVGMTSNEISTSKAELSPDEEQVSECIVKMIDAEDRLQYGKFYLEGLRLMLSQPEFANSPRILNILEVLEEENWLRNIPWRELNKGEVKVIIGQENPEPALQDLSLVVSQYGIPDKAGGIVGVLGPKRMDYVRAISSLSCFSALLSNSVAEYV